MRKDKNTNNPGVYYNAETDVFFIIYNKEKVEYYDYNKYNLENAPIFRISEDAAIYTKHQDGDDCLMEF